MGTWMPLLIAIVSVSAVLCGNYCLQKKMLAIHNKEKAVDLLVKTINELKDLYIEYWENNKHDKSCSQQIKIIQTQFSILFYFLDKKYSLKNKDEFESCITTLFAKATGDDFDSSIRDQSKPDKCIDISKLINEVIVAALHNKI